jgi:hypothetical protein
MPLRIHLVLRLLVASTLILSLHHDALVCRLALVLAIDIACEQF